jgi:hypothetical protein
MSRDDDKTAVEVGEVDGKLSVDVAQGLVLLTIENPRVKVSMFLTAPMVETLVRSLGQASDAAGLANKFGEN